MMKKLGAIALTATMMLSLIGCSKKNFDGNYTADVDLSEARSCLCVCRASFLMTFAMGGVPHSGPQQVLDTNQGSSDGKTNRNT